MHFQHKLVQSSSSYIQNFYAIILKMKEEYSNIAPSQQCKFHTSVTVKIIFSGQHNHLQLWNMDKKMTMDVT